MYTKGQNTDTDTLIAYVGPSQDAHGEYLAVEILFAETFDISGLPKSVRAKRMMWINCTPRDGNAKNEAGVKRLRRILKALDGTPVKVLQCYGNSITEAEFFKRAA